MRKREQIFALAFVNVLLIGGDGPKKLEIEEMREKHQLHERIELLGGVKHSEVRKVG